MVQNKMPFGKEYTQELIEGINRDIVRGLSQKWHSAKDKARQVKMNIIEKIKTLTGRKMFLWQKSCKYNSLYYI